MKCEKENEMRNIEISLSFILKMRKEINLQNSQKPLNKRKTFDKFVKPNSLLISEKYMTIKGCINFENYKMSLGSKSYKNVR